MNVDNEKLSLDKFFEKINNSYLETDKKTSRNVQEVIRELDPIQAASAFCGLATVGCLQSNHIRISNLIHASLKLGAGKKQITETQIGYLFKLFESSTVARDEDPAEDVFIATICTKYKSYRIFEGNWESSAFYLERFIDIVDNMPDSGRFKKTKCSVYALLNLSDIVVSNSNAEVNSVAGDYPLPNIPSDALISPNLLRQRVCFKEEELKKYGIEISDILPFIFDMSSANNLPFPCHHSLTDLDKYPILEAEDGNYYLFPQGISTAIRTYIMSEYAVTEKEQKILTSYLIKSYCQLLSRYQLLGTLPFPPIEAFYPIRHGNVFMQELLIDISKGRPLHLLILFDGFYGDFNNWATNPPVMFDDAEIEISKKINSAHKTAALRYEVKHGVTLLITASWGRAYGFMLDFQDTDDWSLRHLSMHDLCHLSDYPEMKPLHLWRMIETEKRFEALGGRIHNMNGVLNILGWIVANKGHIVPHENIPQQDLKSGVNILIPTNYIANVRATARRSKDRIMISDIDGNPHYLMKYAGDSYFGEDENIKLYACFDLLIQGKLSAAYLGKSSIWWCCVNNPNKEGSDFSIWESAIHWLSSIDDALTKSGLSVPPITEMQLCIQDSKKTIPVNEQFSSKTIREGRILINIKTCPSGLLHRPDNAGEVALIKAFLCELLKESDNIRIADLLDMIFPNQDAKHCHLFQGITFNDYISKSLPAPVIIEEVDDAILRLGLGWVDKRENCYLKIQGVNACVEHLNKVIDKVWSELEKKLKIYNKVKLCEKLLVNLEAIRKTKTVWTRTIRANLALHLDKNNVYNVVNYEISKLTAASLGSRLAIEMALCTSSDDAQMEADELDISTILGNSLLMFYLGSWSDAIRACLYPPEVHISSFGQVMMDYNFEKNVIHPYQNVLAKQEREVDAKKYENLYDSPVSTKPIKDLFPYDFLNVWEKEFHIPGDVMRNILDYLEDWGISKKEVIYKLKKSELVEFLFKSIEGSGRQSLWDFLSRISLPVREKWNQDPKCLPDNMQSSDWYPWNFRRKLSLVSRPLIELDKTKDPLLLINPSAIREGVIYTFENSYEAVFDEKYFYTDEMKKWIGKRRNEQGNAFNHSVAQKMTELGWSTECNVLISKILNKKTEYNWGDIDVLSWSKKHDAVVIAECKDLYYAKTHKEIGNQISEFKGEINSKGKRDRLRKHFDRLNILAANTSAITKYTSIEKPKVYGLLVLSQRNVLEYAPQIPQDRIYVSAIQMLTSPSTLIPQLIQWTF